MGEIATTCANVGGTFSSSLGGEYQCSDSCGDGKLAQCPVTKRAIAKVRAKVAVNADNSLRTCPVAAGANAWSTS
jgi:hypothetical protein